MKTTKHTTIIGIDLGDKAHETCTLDAASGKVLSRSKVPNDREELERFCGANPGAHLILEAGTHSPWISRLFEAAGHKVTVANPRKVRAIYKSERKTDVRDAEMLARIGRFDPDLLYAVSHCSEERQRARKVIDVRDTLVACRVKLINSVRGTLKSLGVMLDSSWSSACFARKAKAHLDDLNYGLVAPLLETIGELTERIKERDAVIELLIAEAYPEAQPMRQIPGVGPITALAFVLTVGDPDRFAKPRDIGPYLGLVPRRDQSGSVDKELGVTKSGNRLLRRLLVSCAQYVLGRHGPDCALRRSGLARIRDDGKADKKKAVVKTARKLAVLMLALWKNPGSEYQPFPEAA